MLITNQKATSVETRAGGYVPKRAKRPKKLTPHGRAVRGLKQAARRAGQSLRAFARGRAKAERGPQGAVAVVWCAHKGIKL